VAGFAARHSAVAHTFVSVLDDDLTLDDEAGHHLSRVRRIRAGDVITAADGRGHWRPYVVARVERGTVGLRAQDAPVEEPRLEPRLVVAFALTKGAKPDLVVQKLTELGVDGVTVLAARRSVPRWSDERAAAAVARLRKIAHEAAAQCRRARVPEVDGLRPVTDLRGRPGLVLADREGDDPAALRAPSGGEWVLVVGPEGGFDRAEAAVLEGRRLRLAPHVLRAETAAIAGGAVLATKRTQAPDIRA